MIKIGDFSKLSLVSIKKLRYYDEMGLLKTVHVDQFKGYYCMGIRRCDLPLCLSNTVGSGPR